MLVYNIRYRTILGAWIYSVLQVNRLNDIHGCDWYLGPGMAPMDSEGLRSAKD